METIRQMVAAGMGCTLLPTMALGSGEEHHLELRPLADKAFRRIGLVYVGQLAGASQRTVRSSGSDARRLGGLLHANS